MSITAPAIKVPMNGPSRSVLTLLPILFAGCVPGISVSTSRDAAKDASTTTDAANEHDGRAPSREGGADAADASVDTGPSVFVIDSTNHLFAFDRAGHSMGSVAIAGDVNLGPDAASVTAGGGIAVADGKLYVSTAAPGVVAFELDLTPVNLAKGSFPWPPPALPGLTVPRGIAYDAANSELYIADIGYGVVAFSLSGARETLTGTFPNGFGPSGIAYDPDDQTLWVANYVGRPAADPPTYGIAEYTAEGNAVNMPNYANQFEPPLHEEPYAITVCTKAATGSTLVVAGFVDDGSQLGTAAVQAYTVDGAKHGAPLPGDFTKPLGLSCDSSGRVFIADGSGLGAVDLAGGTAIAIEMPAGAFGGLTAPILGVLVTN
jgi:hypothetical protein